MVGGMLERGLLDGDRGRGDSAAELARLQTGKRQGPAVRFPRFRKKTKDSLRCTCTTGAMRVDGSRHVVLPGVGRVETPENIRALWRHVRRGTGRVMSATIREKAGRWFVSLRLEIKAKRAPEPRTAVAGADLGIGRHLLIVMRPDGTVAEKIPNPRALRASLTDLRRANRALARKHEGTPRWRAAKLRLGRAHARAANIRTDAIHQATTRLAKTHGAVVIEDLAPRQHMRGSAPTENHGPTPPPGKSAASSPAKPHGTARNCGSRTAGTHPRKPAPRAGTSTPPSHSPTGRGRARPAAPHTIETRTPERIWRVSRPVRPRRNATVRPGLPGTSR